MSRPVVVIGAGINGLVAAARLARAGRRVRVLEAGEEAGGLAAGREFAPGYRAPGILHDAAGFRPVLARALGLSACGLAWDDGPPLGGLRELLDATAVGSFVERVRPALRQVLDRPPPPLAPSGLAELWGLAVQGVGLRRLGARELRELLRVLAMPAGDWLADLGLDAGRAEAIAGSALLGSFHGPRSPGGAALVLLRAAVEGRRPTGGSPALAGALLVRCAELGVEVTTGCPAVGVVVEKGRVTGVETADGVVVTAATVVATCDPRTALSRLLPSGLLGVETTRRVEAWRCRGTAAKIHLALSSPLCVEGEPSASFRVGGGGPDDLERAFDAVKYAEMSAEPFLEVVQPSTREEGWAPKGRHVASILAGWVPYALRGGWNEGAVTALRERVLARLQTVDPGAEAKVEHVEVLTPLDLEREVRSTGGHLHHGEQALDQMFFLRPVPEMSRYATPVGGFFLGGSGSHPGGGITGVPGWLAAGTALRSGF